MKQQLKNIFILIFCAIILNGCGATLLTYKPVENSNILGAMRTIRNKILTQPAQKSPSQVEITENTLKIIGNFEGKKFKKASFNFFSKDYKEAVGLMNFKDITEIKYHTKSNWFMVSLINKQSNDTLFRYFSHNETDAQQFIDNIETLIKHKVDPSKPIVLTKLRFTIPEVKKLHGYEQTTGLIKTGLCETQTLNNRLGICSSQNRRFSR